jgi:hypothetical protein
MTRFHGLSLLLVPLLVLALSQDAEARRCGRRGGCCTSGCASGGCATGTCANGACSAAATTAAPVNGQATVPPAPPATQGVKTAPAPRASNAPAAVVQKRAPSTLVRPAQTTQAVE